MRLFAQLRGYERDKRFRPKLPGFRPGQPEQILFTCRFRSISIEISGCSLSRLTLIQPTFLPSTFPPPKAVASHQRQLFVPLERKDFSKCVIFQLSQISPPPLSQHRNTQKCRGELIKFPTDILLPRIISQKRRMSIQGEDRDRGAK